MPRKPMRLRRTAPSFSEVSCAPELLRMYCTYWSMLPYSVTLDVGAGAVGAVVWAWAQVQAISVAAVRKARRNSMGWRGKWG